MLNENELINHPSPNYTEGRQGVPIRHITFHHVVGSAASALARFDNPASQVSAHFVVGATAIYCCVNTDDTAWTNGDWNSNLESVTIEHEGDWRNGFRDEAVLANSARLVAWLMSLYPSASPMRHRDVIPTACPGDLPVEEIWDRAHKILHPEPAPTPAPVLYWRLFDHNAVQLAAYSSAENAIKGWVERGAIQGNRIKDPVGNDITPTPAPVPSPQPTPEPEPNPDPVPDPTPSPSPSSQLKALIIAAGAAIGVLASYLIHWLFN